MILCDLSSFARYAPVHPGFDRILELLDGLDLEALPEGRRDLDGDRLFVMVSPAARTRSATEALLEAHRRYVDVQVILRGTDRMGWAPRNTCQDEVQPYDPERDIVFYADPPLAHIDVQAGRIAIFFPEDAHAPLIGDGSTVHKVVFKVQTSPACAASVVRRPPFGP